MTFQRRLNGSVIEDRKEIWNEGQRLRKLQFWETEELDYLNRGDKKISQEEFDNLTKEGRRWFNHELKKGRIEINDTISKGGEL